MASILLVELPPGLREKITACDESSEPIFDHRTNARRPVLRQADLQVISSPQGLASLAESRPGRISAASLIKDLSRSGVGFYFHEQLFPSEQINIKLQNHSIRAVVVRCRYLGHRCFEIGAVVHSVHAEG
ncbi:MAG TPA: hypothetical protein DCF63_16980 [Planctomycetaceae bacterium]|nr:hypothetical protein [Planctomycetaceae bacterium]